MIFQFKNRIFVKTKKVKSFSIPFLFVLTFLLIFFNKTDYFLAYKIKSTGIDIINPISNIISKPINLTLKTYDFISQMNSIKKENETLKEEIVRLKKWQKIAIIKSNENNAYKKLLNSTDNTIDLIKTASVISHQPKIYKRSLLINAGSKDRIENNFTVINERGLVGKIIFVSENNSRVLLVNDQSMSVPVKIFNKDFYAILKGSTKGKFLISSFVKDNKKPILGDILVTSGNANVYPRDILVGKVVSVSDDKFVVLPFVDTKNIEYVQIIKNN